MIWEDYIKKYRFKEIVVIVNSNIAGHMYSNYSMPQRLRVKQAALRWLFFGGIILAIGLIFVKWWIPLIVLAIALYSSTLAIKTAANDVFNMSLNNKNIFSSALYNKAIVIYEKNDYIDKIIKQQEYVNGARLFLPIILSELSIEDKKIKISKLIKENSNLVIVH